MDRALVTNAPNPVDHRSDDLKNQMQRGIHLFGEFMEKYVNAGRLAMDPQVLKALRLDCATISEQFAIVSEAAGTTADAVMDDEDGE